jgi:hypothetical protein
MENIAEKVKEKLKGAKEEVKVLLRNVLAVVVLLPKKTEHLKRVAQ